MVCPCRWSAMVLVATPMMVMSRAASSMPSISPYTTSRICRCGSAPSVPDCASGIACDAGSDIYVLPFRTCPLDTFVDQRGQVLLVVGDEAFEQLDEPLEISRRPV